MKATLTKVTVSAFTVIVIAALAIKGETNSSFFTRKPFASLASMVSSSKETYTVNNITDGDSIWVSKNGKQIEVRLACIDAPEPTQPWGSESAEKLKQLLPPDQKVELRETGKDRYNRTVAELFLNGQSVNLRMV
ncbi:hypothetical protein RIVM261_088820 [Rivularia sp. IAM M-261]|nr:hypothetical protein RIVM261_088820 [Rivularia sp. IAM M-261]